MWIVSNIGDQKFLDCPNPKCYCKLGILCKVESPKLAKEDLISVYCGSCMARYTLEISEGGDVKLANTQVYSGSGD
jgi:hypothetical protein